MKINVIYFAALREQAKKSQEFVETTSTNASELMLELYEKYHFTLDQTMLKVAINDEYSSPSTLLKENDTIAFIPPVAGG